MAPPAEPVHGDPGGSHSSPGSMIASPHELVGGIVVVVLLPDGVVVVVASHIPPSHASQQLEQVVATAPGCRSHTSALGAMVHCVLPFGRCRQHATPPSSRPHVDFAAHLTS